MQLLHSSYLITSLTLLFGILALKPSTLNATSCILQGNDTDLLGCPAWFAPGEHNGSCQCGDDVPFEMIHCDSTTNQTQISHWFCATLDEESGKVYGGSCPYNNLVNNEEDLFEFQRMLPHNASELNEAMCGPLNRTGLLCSQCKEGSGPPVLSYTSKCLECFNSGYGWILYVLAALLPTTVFCIIIIACRIDASIPTLNIVIMVCQLLINIFYTNTQLFTSPGERLNFVKLGGLLFYGVWNLDFCRIVLPPFCISTRMNVLQVQALDYLVALYPLVVTAIAYYCIEFHDRGYKVLVILWKPFHPCFAKFRRSLKIKASVINAFTTFFLLSYCKILFTSVTLLTPTYLYDSCGNTRLVLFYQPSLPFLSSANVLYVLLALTFSFAFTLFPLVYILFYQNKQFQRCLAICRLNFTVFSEMAKLFHKSFKNGVDDKCDCRWYAGSYLVYRILFAIVHRYVSTFINQASAVITLIFITGVLSLLCALLQPYKNKFYNIFDSVTLGLMTFTGVYLGYFISENTFNLSLIPFIVLPGLPVLYFICFIVYKLLRKTNAVKRFQTLIHAVKNKIKNSSEDQHVPSYRLTHPSEYEREVQKSTTESELISTTDTIESNL